MIARRAAPAWLALSLALCGCVEIPSAARAAEARSAGPVVSRVEAAEPTRYLRRFNTRRALVHVRRLSRGVGVRVRATRGERRGIRYVANELRAQGYRVRVRGFSVDGRRSHNLTAVWPSAVKHPFVVGAHIDTVAGSPGANDNASGVAVILELARLSAGTRRARYAKFVVFGAEEYGTDGRHHVGSAVFVKRIGRRGRARLPGMVSVDMIADGRPLIVGTAGIGPGIVARALYRRVRGAGIEVVRRTTCDCSDNGPFERAGIPAAFAWSGPEADYHSPSDTARNLSRRDLRRSGRALRVFVRSLRPETLRRFRKQR